MKTFYQAFSYAALLAIAALPCIAHTAAGKYVTAANGALRVTMSADGSYTVTATATGWELQGKLAAPVREVHASEGVDRIGRYQQVSAVWDNGARRAEMRVYESKPLSLFRDVWTHAGPNQSPFPSFASLPTDTYLLSFQKVNFGFYEFGKLGTQGPWVFFDRGNRALILSPADNFLVSAMDAPANGNADSRIVPEIGSLPAGFAHGTLIAADSGIRTAFADWGSALMDLGGKRRSANDADVTLSKLGYWTDNLTTYYYRFDPRLGYAGTLLAVHDEFNKLGLQLGYMQLDSWFYPKGPQSRWDTLGNTVEWGEDEYRADKVLFPDGLDAFHQRLGVPMVTHARWIAPQSPYRKEFKMSGNVIIDPRFWVGTANYLRRAGVVTYEQDWLDKNAQAAVNLTDPRAFLGEMAKSMSADGISIQYCMPLPADYMASTLYQDVQTIRTSGDEFRRARWDRFLYDSQMAYSLGVWPWTDAFFSKDLGSLVISTLSAGPVGVGDAIGGVNVANLKAAIRADGTIIKPDSPILPIDATYLREAQDPETPMVAAAESTFGGGRMTYVFAYPRRPSDSSVQVSLKSLGLEQPVYAWNWVTHQGETIPANGLINMAFVNGWAYEVLTPIGPDGLALLGDLDNIAPLGRARIASLSQDKGLTFTVRFAVNEKSVRIFGYAAKRPQVTAQSGQAKLVDYRDETHLFALDVEPARSEEATIKVTCSK